MNKDLAIAIPTFNRDEIIAKNFKHILPEIIKYSIPIYISDNSNNCKTEEFFKHVSVKYENIFYYKNHIDIGHDMNSFFILKKPKTKYVWLLGDGIFFKKDTINKILHIIKEYNPNLISVNVVNRGINIKSDLYLTPTEVIEKFGWHLTLTGASIYSQQIIKESNKIEKSNFKNFPQIPLIFNNLSQDCRFYWLNDEVIDAPKKKGYWVGKMFEIFIDDWTNAVMNTTDFYTKSLKYKVIKDHSFKSRVFSIKALISARYENAYNLKVFFKYRKKLFIHSQLGFIILFLIALLPRFILKIIVNFRKFISK